MSTIYIINIGRPDRTISDSFTSRESIKNIIMNTVRNCTTIFISPLDKKSATLIYIVHDTHEYLAARTAVKVIKRQLLYVREDIDADFMDNLLTRL